MTFSYALDLITDKDKVRLTIGDTDGDSPALQDEEIEYFLSIYTSVKSSALACVETLIGRYAGGFDRSLGPLSLSLSQRYEHWKQVRMLLKETSSLENAYVFAGGISASDKLTRHLDEDRVHPGFSVTKDELSGIRREE